MSLTVYTGVGGATGPNGVTHKNTAVITAGPGGTLTHELVSSENGQAEYRARFMVAPIDTSLAFTYLCPTGTAFALPYTVSGNEITLAVGVARVEVYARQP